MIKQNKSRRPIKWLNLSWRVFRQICQEDVMLMLPANAMLYNGVPLLLLIIIINSNTTSILSAPYNSIKAVHRWGQCLLCKVILHGKHTHLWPTGTGGIKNTVRLSHGAQLHKCQSTATAITYMYSPWIIWHVTLVVIVNNLRSWLGEKPIMIYLLVLSIITCKIWKSMLSKQGWSLQCNWKAISHSRLSHRSV